MLFRGACALAERIPAGLQQLGLNFLDCEIGAAGARAFAEAMNRIPTGLRDLFLRLEGCPIGADAARALVERIPVKLRKGPGERSRLQFLFR